MRTAAKIRREKEKPMHLHRYRRRIHRLLPVLERILQTGRYPNNLPERIDKTLEYKHTSWLDDIIIVMKRDLKKHETEVRETMKKLENAGYRLNPRKCEFFKTKIEWVGHKIDHHGIRPLQDKLEAITKINTPKTRKNQNLFLEQYNTFRNIFKNLSANTIVLGKLLKKNNE